MQQRYLMTSMVWGAVTSCPTPYMPDNVGCGWKLLQTTVTAYGPKQNLFLFTWTWERL